MAKAKTDWHWFTSSQVNWSADNSLTKCLTRQRRADKGLCGGCTVWRVPGECSVARYDIDNYQPQVEGAVFVGHETY